MRRYMSDLVIMACIKIKLGTNWGRRKNILWLEPPKILGGGIKCIWYMYYMGYMFDADFLILLIGEGESNSKHLH